MSSVRLSVCDVGGSGTQTLPIFETIARTISATPSLFVAQRPSTYSQENMGTFWGEVEWRKLACWRTKAAISLKLVKIEEKWLWRAYRNSSTLFRTIPSPTPYGLPFPKIGGSQAHPKIAITIISRTGKATNFKFEGTLFYRVDPNKSPLKILEKRERVRIQGLPKIFEYPPLSQEGIKLWTSNFVRTFLV